MKETFSNNLKGFRKEKQLSQEQLAEQLGITTQAVSKWECGLSYPDIDLLPQLADLFGVSIDTLLRGDAASGAGIPFPQPDLPDDNVLRIVQYRGNTLLRKDTYDPNIRIPLSLTCERQTKTKLFQNKVSVMIQDSTSVEIWGSADIFGDLNGSADIGTSVTCSGDINGDVKASGNVDCGGDVNGDLSASGSVSCGGDVNGDLSANVSVSCGGDVNGNLSAGGSVSCGGDINGSISANGNVDCSGDIDGSISAGGSVSCDGDIDGDIQAGGQISHN